jgi:hypothetical protein
MITERERTSCREHLGRVGESSLDCESLRRKVIAELRRVIGFDRWCWPLADPDTLTQRLFISRHTVFGKPGIHSRRELLATFSASADRRAREPLQDTSVAVASASA